MCHKVTIQNLHFEWKLAIGSKLCGRQNLWPRPLKFWYKKRQLMFFQRKKISNHSILASRNTKLLLFLICAWSPCIKKLIKEKRANFVWTTHYFNTLSTFIPNISTKFQVTVKLVRSNWTFDTLLARQILYSHVLVCLCACRRIPWPSGDSFLLTSLAFSAQGNMENVLRCFCVSFVEYVCVCMCVCVCIWVCVCVCMHISICV